MSLLGRRTRGLMPSRSNPSQQQQTQHGQQAIDTFARHIGKRLTPPVPLTVSEELSVILIPLEAEIRDIVRSPACGGGDDTSCIITTEMVKDSGGLFRPRLIISCDSQTVLSHLKRKLYANCQALRNSSFGVPIFKSHENAADQHPSFIDTKFNSEDVDSILGSRLFIKDEAGAQAAGWTVTVGGVIMVDDVPHGLTIGHYTRYSSLKSPDEDNSWKTGGSSRIFRGRIVANRFGSDDSVGEVCDWALAKVYPPQSIANRLHLPFHSATGPECLLGGIMCMQDFINLAGSKRRLICLVATHHGLVPALVDARLCIMTLNDGLSEILVVYLDIPLPRGSSGSWIIVNNQLLGTIIATQGYSDPPVAFVMPAETTIRSIKRFTGASKISLPSRTDTRMVDIQNSTQTMRWLKPTKPSYLFELELLQAIKQTEAPEDGQYQFGSISSGFGWAGMRREEVLSFPLDWSGVSLESSLKTAAQESLTGLKLETIRSLMKIGHVFPTHSEFHIQFRRWMKSQAVSRIHGSRHFAMRLIVEKCLSTQAGENLLSLICTLKSLLRQTRMAAADEMEHGPGRVHRVRAILDRVGWTGRHARDHEDSVWTRKLLLLIFKALKFLPTQIPSEPQIQTFAMYCLLGFKGTPGGELGFRQRPSFAYRDSYSPEHQLHERFDRLSTAKSPFPNYDGTFTREQELVFVAKAILHMGDIANGNTGDMLICSGVSFLGWVGFIAHIFGLKVHVTLGDHRAAEDKPIGDAPVSDADVCLFIATSTLICEVVKKLSTQASLEEPFQQRTRRREWSEDGESQRSHDQTSERQGIDNDGTESEGSLH